MSISTKLSSQGGPFWMGPMDVELDVTNGELRIETRVNASHKSEYSTNRHRGNVSRRDTRRLYDLLTKYYER
jgi:hypothetical protein